MMSRQLEGKIAPIMGRRRPHRLRSAGITHVTLIKSILIKVKEGIQWRTW